MTSDTNRELYGVWGSSPSDVFAVGEFGIILHYNGSTWSEMMEIGMGNFFDGVWGSSSSDVFAVGMNGIIMHYDGSTWSEMESGTTNPLWGIWGSSSSNVFAVGGIAELSTILHYDGSTWSEMESGTTTMFYSVWGRSHTDVFAVGTGGGILHYDGSSWSEMSSGAANDLLCVWGTSSSDDVFAVGDFGTILHYPESVSFPPTITSVSPNQAHQGQTQTVTITGTYLTGATAVTFGSGITVNSFTVDSATQITASITIDGSATVGVRDVSVTTPGGTANLTGGFTVLNGVPTITSVSPSQAHQGQTQTVTITGTYLTGATAVTFGSGVTVNSFTVDSATHITANITIADAATLGARNVSVTTSSGTATLTDGFTVVAITANVPVGSDVSVSLDSAMVTFGTVTAGGTITLTKSAESPSGATPADVDVVGIFADITTTATYSGPVSLAIRYDASGISNEDELKLFHWNGTTWEDVTTSVNTDNNIIFGEVTTLSPFFVGNPTASESTSHLVVYVVVGIVVVLAVGIVAYFVRKRRVAH